MRRFFCFWWSCLVRARRGSAAFANDWQWLVGLPVLAFLAWFYRAYLDPNTQQFLTGQTALGAFIVALIAFVLTMLASFVLRIFIWPPILYYEEKNIADNAENELRNRLAPQINVFLDEESKGVTESPTEL
jgi:hypothetical protein